jgi:hypothetical protein
MTERNKFEEMLERLVNEDRAGAEELFHEIVVEKSRSIYQSIIESDDEEVDEAEDDDLEESDDEEVDESEEDELEESTDDDLDEMFGLDEFESEAEEDPMAAMGGDATDDMMGDISMDDEEEGDEEEGDEGEEGPEAAIDNLEDALDALKAEFEKLMGGDSEEPDADQMDGASDMDFDSEEPEGEEEPEESSFQATITPLESRKVAKSAGEQMREYVEKVTGKMGDNGVNTKSIVAGKNDMGGTTANIAKSKTEAGVEANKGQLKGSGLLKGTPKVDNAGNVNVPGARGATKMASQPGHGAEKKGTPETADKSAGSVLNGAPKRAK